MADNSTLPATADVIRDKDRAGVKTQVVGLDVGIGTGTEKLMGDSGLPIKAGVLNLQTGAITTSTTTVTATTDVSSAGTVLVVIAGTYAGVNATFEGSVDGSTWVPVQGTRVDAPVTESSTGVLVANTTRAWEFPAAAFQQFRVRATAFTSGSAAVAIAASPLAIDPSPTVGIIGADTSTLTQPSNSASSFTVLAANPSRRGAMIYNDSGVTVYVALAATASTTAYTVQIPSGGYYELPAPVYKGLVTGIAASATGSLRVSELT